MMDLLTKLMLNAAGAAEYFVDCRHICDFQKYFEALENLEQSVRAVRAQREFLAKEEK